MNLKEIRDECWGIARDDVGIDSDKFWRKDEMNRYINRTYRKIARETKCIRDAVTPSVCLIAVAPVDYITYTPGTIDYIWANTEGDWLYHQNVAPYRFTLHDSILAIDEVKWTNNPWILRHVSVTKWQKNAYWEKVVGVPTEFATDLSNNVLALNYRYNVSDTLRLAVRRMPLASLAADEDVPEFRLQYHDFFLNGVLEQMYQKLDPEIFDKTKSTDRGRMFLEDLDEIKQQESLLNLNRIHVNNSLVAFR